MDNIMEDLTERIAKVLSEGPATPDDVSRRLGVAWSTAHGQLLRLVGEGKVALTKKGRVNVFYLRGGKRLVFKVPAWVKAKGLKELAEELEEYFTEDLSSAEMVSRERRRL
jgi:DNA-binding transcriptional ArsR family regulator